MNCLMKRSMMLLAVLVFVMSTAALDAQTKMTKEDWQKQMMSFTSQRDSLKKLLGTLTKDVDSLTAVLAAMDLKIKNVHDETMAMAGASEELKKEFDQKLSSLEKWADDLARLANQDLYARKNEVDSLQTGLDDVKKSKLSAVKPFFERIQSLQQKIDGLRATLAKPEVIVTLEKTYVVGTWAKDKDCLWNISKKKDIYDNPFMWPKIWQGNRDQIKDPDIIKKGQKLKIPVKGDLTNEEKKAEQKYWHKKRMAHSK